MSEEELEMDANLDSDDDLDSDLDDDSDPKRGGFYTLHQNV